MATTQHEKVIDHCIRVPSLLYEPAIFLAKFERVNVSILEEDESTAASIM